MLLKYRKIINLETFNYEQFQKEAVEKLKSGKQISGKAGIYTLNAVPLLNSE
jgi:hypothetical protein